MVKLLDSKAVAEILGVNQRTARELMYSMRYINITGANDKPHLRVRPEELDRWINERTAGTRKVIQCGSSHRIKRREA